MILDAFCAACLDIASPNPIRWPLYFIICVMASVSLYCSMKAGRSYATANGERLGLLVLRWPMGLTLCYGLFTLGRAIFVWVDPYDAYSIAIFQDPPSSLLIATFANGVIAAWVTVTALYLYLRSRRRWTL